jgi:hypothetical protein
MKVTDLFVLVAYFVTMLTVGLAYSRQKSCDMYFAGDRHVSWWLGGISFFLCNRSAFAIVVYVGLDINMVWSPSRSACALRRRRYSPPSFSPDGGLVPE